MKTYPDFIQSFIARFRNDVYLESVESGTIASGGNLGLDSNNKIVKAAEVGSSVDLASEVTGVLPVSNGGTGSSTLTNTGVLTGNGTGAIVSNSTMSYSGELLTMSSTSSAKPQIALVNANADAEAPSILFQKTETGADNDDIGLIEFRAENDAGQSNKFATIVGEIETAADGSEGGNLILNVASHDGELNQGIKISDGTTEDQLDVDIANGVGSTTNIAGSLFFGASDGTPHTISLNAHDNGAGGNLAIKAGSVQGGVGNSNLSGGNLELYAGSATGAATGGNIEFYSTTRGSGGDAVNTAKKFASIQPGTNLSNLFLFEAGGATTDDYFQISCVEHGATTISTKDNAAAAAHLAVDVDGDIILDSATGNFDFDVSGNEIASISPGNFNLQGNASQQAKIHLYEDTDNGTNKVSVSAPITVASDKEIKLPDADGTVQLQGTSAGKQLQIFSCNFYDNIGTTKHYLPFKDINEQIYAYQDEVSMLAPCDGRVVSVTLRPHALTISSDCTLTVGINTKPVNVSIYDAYTSEETEALVVTNTGDDSDNHVFHFAFSNEKHFESTEMFSVSLQSNVSMGTNTFWHATVVIEWDWTTFLGATSAELDTTP
tara:strand:- start:535 stop:2352 length:1818 start_codon:yes stop_codon:yes gene_type:complete